MDFIKKHYEKILLSVVLLGLVGALVFMALIIPSEQQKVRDIGEGIIGGRVVALTNLDWTARSNVTARLQSPCQLDFENTNRIFNPVEWVRTADGRLRKATALSPRAAVVTGISPLYTALTLDSIQTNELGARYVVGVERQAAAASYLRPKQQRFVSVDDAKKDVFTLIRVVGPPEDPDYLVLRLADGGQEVQVSKSKPYRRVDGYTVDIKYDPDNRSWTGQRIGNHLKFAGDDYTIVDINSNEVVLSAQSNQKKWTLRYAR
ncbi:MAG TPA: hypothetical protein VN836_02870 [Verrucomicrobiae bacterium]|nr:hypothetical protein [Verrucomicrobiae bacterium]